MRLDKWLWNARFFRSRNDAAAFCAAGKLRIAGQVVRKAHHPVRPGEVLTFPFGRGIRVVRVAALSDRRGSASVARGLYVDLAPSLPSPGLDPAADPSRFPPGPQHGDCVRGADGLAPVYPSGKTRM